MGVATSLRKSARNLIDKFGNTSDYYKYAEATKKSSDEGDDEVTQWGTPTTIKIVVSSGVENQALFKELGVETIGQNELAITDEAEVSLFDRINDGITDFQIMSISKVRVQDTVVMQIVQCNRITVEPGI